MAISRSYSYSTAGAKAAAYRATAAAKPFPDRGKMLSADGHLVPPDAAHKAMVRSRHSLIGQARSKGYKGATLPHLVAFAGANGIRIPKAARLAAPTAPKQAGSAESYTMSRDANGKFAGRG